MLLAKIIMVDAMIFVIAFHACGRLAACNPAMRNEASDALRSTRI
jgi:hypothetical protein